jgi:hypothetical protein
MDSMMERTRQQVASLNSLVTAGAIAFMLLFSGVAPAKAAIGPGDLKTMSNLTLGMAAAKIYFANNNGSYSGFDAAQAYHIQPNLDWADGDGLEVGVVNISGVNQTQVLLESLSSTGKSFCIADDSTRQVVRGFDPGIHYFSNYAGCVAAVGHWLIP